MSPLSVALRPLAILAVVALIHDAVALAVGRKFTVSVTFEMTLAVFTIVYFVVSITGVSS